MLITKELLYKHGACKAQLDKFVELFPDGVDATRKLCLAHAQVFDFTWACCLLSRPARKAYDEALAPASKAYDEAIAPLLEAYNEAVAVAWEAYNEATDPLWEVYNEAAAVARKAYDEAVVPARKAYDEALAYAWFDASQME